MAAFTNVFRCIAKFKAISVFASISSMRELHPSPPQVYDIRHELTPITALDSLQGILAYERDIRHLDILSYFLSNVADVSRTPSRWYQESVSGVGIERW